MKRRDEQGAYAVIVGIFVVVLASIAALAIDIGNAVARKSDVRGQADFAALGAGAQLDDNSPTGSPVPDAVLTEARDLLNENRARNWGSDCTTGPTCIDSNAQLVNGILTDGEVRFANGGLQVLTPYEKVDFALAKVMGFHEADVQGDATVRIGSPLGAVPMYAVSGCDSGPQTLTDPAGGAATPTSVPTLFADSESNGTRLDKTLSPDNSVDHLATTPPIITITGQSFDDTRRVGFFRDDASAPVETNAFTPHPLNGNGSFNVAVPEAVTDVEEVWYIRVWNGPAATPGTTANKWSDRSEAIPLRVGSAFLECDAGSNDGNFGVLDLPRADVTSQDDQIAMNIATTLQAPLSLTTHPGYDPTTGTCVDGVAGAVTSSGPNDRNSGTNCVATKPGLPANAATQGLVTGVGVEPGRLDRATTPGCAPGGGSSQRFLDFSGGNNDTHINNDVLSCFLKDGTTSLEALTTPTAGDAPLLLSDIYDSPRLIFVPVLHQDASNGGSANWSIVDFRPGFITDEPKQTLKGQHLGTSDNGVIINQTDVIQVKVFFFSMHALPPPPAGGEVTDYLGVGPKLVQLVD